MSRYWTDKTDNLDAVSAQDFNEAFKGISEDMSNVEMELSEVKNVSKYIEITDLGSFDGRTVGELKTALANWLNDNYRYNVKCCFDADDTWHTQWGNDLTLISSNNYWTVEIIATDNWNGGVFCLSITSNIGNQLFYATNAYGEWLPLEKAVVQDDILSKDNTTEYTPLEDYNPATKKYVDDEIAEIQTYINTQLGGIENGSY